MPNTSATGGALAPVGVQQAADLNLDLVFQNIAAGVLGFDSDLVRPRWLPDPSPRPLAGTDWCSVGLTRVDSDTNAILSHDSMNPVGPGRDILIRHEQIEVLCSLYGPNASGNAALLRDGMAVPQNREALAALQIAYVAAGNIVRLPDLINMGWINRADIRLTFRRKITRVYPVLNLLSSAGVVDAETISTPFATENPV